MFEVIVPATSANLGPGFDCLGLALNLHNHLQVMSASRLRVEVVGEGANELPQDASNLVWRSALHLFNVLGLAPEPVAIRMHNRIPLSRGLGSSSAAIVSGLLLANHLTGAQLDRQQLLDLACHLEGHPDNVAPALCGGMVISCLQQVPLGSQVPLGLAEVQADSCLGNNRFNGSQVPLGLAEVTAVNYPFPAGLQLVVAVPEFHLATSLARQALPAVVRHQDAAFNLSRLAMMLAALQSGRHDLLAMGTEDRLHQPYRLDLIPGAATALVRAREAGAVAAMISGAGPSLLALVPQSASPVGVGASMTAGFAAAGIKARHMILQLDPVGARIAC